MTTKELRAEVSEASGLTPKVRRIFEYKAVGKTEPEIAALIYRSIKTVNTQAGVILQEMNCKNIQEAIAKASCEGWLTFKYITKNLTVLMFMSGMIGQFLFFDNDIRGVRLTRAYGTENRQIMEGKV